MKFLELITEQPVARKRIVFCRPPAEKTFRNDRTAAFSIEILAGRDLSLTISRIW
jgi:hypothetical protein